MKKMYTLYLTVLEKFHMGENTKMSWYFLSSFPTGTYFPLLLQLLVCFNFYLILTYKYISTNYLKIDYYIQVLCTYFSHFNARQSHES